MSDKDFEKMEENEDKIVMEERTVWACEECGEVSENMPTEPLYECGNCGTIFSKSGSADGSSHQCPDCSKFSSKIGLACEFCESAIAEETDGYYCPDCDIVVISADHLSEEHGQEDVVGEKRYGM